MAGGDRPMSQEIRSVSRMTKNKETVMTTDDREKALDAALGQIEKQFGKGSIMRMGENLHMNIKSIPTGALALDMALGIGGLPRGRIVELYGPESSGKSTLAMHVVAEAQRNGGVCAYIDAEHAMDPVYARAIGVNVDDLLISQPDTGDQHMGLQARRMSQALRKWTGGLSKSNTVACFINQVREKIVIVYGCFHYDARVVLADGTTEKIGKIVNQKMPVEVLSYDAKSATMVPKRVVNWFDNGDTDQFLQIKVAKPYKNKSGQGELACTPNHLIRTPHGWIEAGKLKVGDQVLEALPRFLSEFQMTALRGTLMGAGPISPPRTGLGARFRYSHCGTQTEYADWKASLFANVSSSRFVREDKVVTYDFQPMPELAELRNSVYVDGKKVFDDDYLKTLTPLSLALWYMDDAHFAIRSMGVQKRTEGLTGRVEIGVQSMETATRERLVAYLADTWGLRAQLKEKGATRTAALIFNNAESAKFHALIAPFVHPSKEYKLLPRFRGHFKVEPEFDPMRFELVAMPVTFVGVKPKTRSMRRFDIEVEDSHNYLVDGVMVHNSPEVTPGGRALKFYASVRLDIRRIESIKDGTEVVGNRTRVKVVKNKCAAPFKQAEFDIIYGQGISREGSVLDVAVELGFVKKAGAWFTYEGEQMGQGRENVKTFLRENPQTMAEIDGRVREHMANALLPDVVGADVDIDAPLT